MDGTPMDSRTAAQKAARASGYCEVLMARVDGAVGRKRATVRYAAGQILIFGSSQSRSESPNRLKANTARLIATPGNTIIHGAC